MAACDPVIREAKVAAEADVFACDLGVAGGKIAALGHDLPKGEPEIAGLGCRVTSGGINGHIHLSQDVGADARRDHGTPSGAQFSIHDAVEGRLRNRQ